MTSTSFFQKKIRHVCFTHFRQPSEKRGTYGRLALSERSDSRHSARWHLPFFHYLDVHGKHIKDKTILARIAGLALPPAWTDVWIAASATAHLQATGRDARGRKQYRYHTIWRAFREETKFARMRAFGCTLPLIRKHVERDLARSGLPREKVLATVVRLLEITLIRVGNEEYAKANHSYGLTTLRNRHVNISGAELIFEFNGKSTQSGYATGASP